MLGLERWNWGWEMVGVGILALGVGDCDWHVGVGTLGQLGQEVGIGMALGWS